MGQKETFSIKRTLQLLRYYLRVERGSLGLFAIISAIAVQIPYLFSAFLVSQIEHYDESKGTQTDIIMLISGFGLLIALAIMAFGASMISNDSKKEELINNIMLPARNSEKFVARLLLCTIGVYAVVILSHIAGILIYRALLYAMEAPKSLHDTCTILFDIDIFEIFDKEYRILTSILGLLYSLYFLGGVIWRRKSFIRTTSLIFISWPLLFLIPTHLFNDSPHREAITSISYTIISLLILFSTWKKFKVREIAAREPKMWKIVITIILTYAALSVYSGRTIIIIEEERLERITEIDFPEYTHIEETFYNNGGILGDFTTSSIYRFDEQPAEDFYHRLDSLAQIKGPSGWLKYPGDPQSGTNAAYFFSSSWGNGSPAPEGEAPDADRFIHVIITKGKQDFEITFGAH